MPDYEIKIKTAADLAAAQQVPPVLQNIVTAATAGERAQASLDQQLRAASPAALEKVSASLQEIIARATAAGEETSHLSEQLARVTGVQTGRTDAAQRATDLERETQATRELAAAQREAAEREAQATRARAEALSRQQAILAELRRSEAQAGHAAPAETAAQSFDRIVESATHAERAEAAFKRTLDSLSPAALKTVESELKAFIVSEEAAGRETGQLRAQLQSVLSAPFDRAEAGMQKLTEETGKGVLSMDELTHKSESFLSQFTLGFGLVAGGEAIIHTIEGIGHAFVGLVERGLDYNAEMQNQANNLGAALRGMDPEKYLNFEAARVTGERNLEVLRAKANALGLEFKPLAETFGIVMPTMMESGITKTAEQMDVLIRLNQMATAKGLSGAQAMRDILDELSGRTERTIFGKELNAFGLTKEVLEEAKRNGTEAQVILEKTSSYGEAAAANADSYAGKLRTVHNELERLEGLLAKPTFDVFSRLLGDAKSGGGSTQAEVVATAFGKSIGDATGLVEKFASAVESKPWLQKFLLTGFNQAVMAPLSVLPDAGLVTGAALGSVEDNVAHAKADAANAKPPDTAADDAAEVKAAADRRAKRDREADEKYQASPRGQAARDGIDADKAAVDQDKLNEKIEKHIQQLTKLYPQASREWVKGKAEEEVAAEHFGGAIDKLNEKLDKAAGKTDTLHDIRRKLAEKSKDFADSIPGDVRDKFSDEQIYSGNPATNGLLDAVRGTQMDIAAKEKLLSLLLQIVELDKERGKLEGQERKEFDHVGQGVGKGADQATAKAQSTADAVKRHDDALKAAQDENAVLELRAKGENALADAKQKELDLQRDITALEREGLTYAEAAVEAARRQSLEQQGKDAAFKKQQSDEAAAKTKAESERDHPLAFREGESAGDYHRRTGGIDGRARDADAAGGLHGGITGSDFVSNNPPTSSVALRPLGAQGLAAPGLLSSLFAGTAAGGLFGGAPTAAQGIAPALPGLGAPVQAGGSGSPASDGSKGTASALDGVAGSANKAGGALESSTTGLKSSAQNLRQSFNTLSEKLKGVPDLKSQLDSLQSDVNALASQVAMLTNY